MPVVANVNLLAGTKSSSTCTTDAADSFCLCRNEAQRLFLGGGRERSVTCLRFQANCCPQECPPQTGKVTEGRGENEVRQTGRERGRSLPFQPTFADR